MDPAKLSTIRDWPYPVDLRQLNRFLGFTNFYRRFIDHFSTISEPLTSLTSKGVDVAQALLDPRCRQAFESLRTSFSTAPFLLHFDFDKPCVLQVDCSGFALLAILSQPNSKGELQPVSFMSRKLTKPERLWQVHDQELGAIVAAFEEWRAWLVGTNSPVTVFSDHSNLHYFMTSQKLTPRQACWASYLGSFYFSILHTPGKLNPADPASRRPDYEAQDSVTDPVVLFSISQLVNGLKVMSMPTSVSSIDISFSLPAVETCALLTDAYPSERGFLEGSPGPLYRFRGALWWYRDRLYVPSVLRPTILSAFHDSPSMGHPGVARMLSVVSRTFSWPTLKQDLLLFVKSCDSCQRTKIDTSKRTGQLVPLPVPDRPWSVIGIDMIVKLPLSDGHDSIFVITDHLTKGAHFIPCRESMDSAELAELFVYHFFRHHGFPDKIVSDRGATFVSAFWTAVQKKLSILPAPSTAYHPQTDGQTERTNQTLETYLRHFVGFRQDDWADWLAMAEFTFNNTPNTSTKLSPFFAWQGFHPRANSFTAPSRVPTADAFVELLEDIQVLLACSLRSAKLAQARVYDQHSKPSPVYKSGDLVWLTRRFIPSQRPSLKLDFRRVGPFVVDRMVGLNAVRLRLGDTFSRLHPVFNISLISPFIDPRVAGRANTTAPDPGSSIPIHQWRHVTAILDYRLRGKKHPEYLLRWLHGSPADDTWVPLTDISTSLDPFLLQFHHCFPKLAPPPTLLCKARFSYGFQAVPV